MPVNTGSQILSKLGSPDSKIPLAVKDIFNSAGYTYFSYDAGGSIEAKDRLLDEAGTGALWLFGIPAYKKLIDKTIFKKSGISPQVDVRVIKDKNYLKSAADNAPTKEIYEEIKKAGANAGKTKSLTILKFILSMGLTAVSYFSFTKFKQYLTKKNIEKEYLNNKKNKDTNISPYNNENPIFTEITESKPQNNLSFGSAKSAGAAEEFILNPVKNMMALDICISGERLLNARTKGEFAEYGIKEGAFLFFVYGADKLIKKGLNNASEKFLHIPLNLDAKFLSSDLAFNVLNNNSMQEEIKAFRETFTKNTDPAAVYDFIFKNQNNTVVKAAMKSDIISTVKDTAGNTKIDTRKFIDTKKMQKLAEDLQKFIDLSKNNKNIQSYLNKTKIMKTVSTMMNVGICCLFLGFIVPKIMYAYRNNSQGGTKDFHVRTEYEKELETKEMNNESKK